MSREKFVSAMKRKDIKELGAIILEEIYGEEEKAKELSSASRITVALIDRTCVESEVEPESEPEPTLDEDVQKAVDTGEETPARKIELLIESGNFKKAKKALKKLDEDHPNYKEFKKSIKKGLK